MPLKQNDFIEIEFTGRIKDSYIFDSNIKEDLKSINPNLEAKPLIFCLGQGMFLKGVEDFLIGKEIGVYEIYLSPEKAFGKRDQKLIHIIPMKVFKEHKLNPVQGATLTFDNAVGKILAVSGGRVIVDFNNPLAGKEVIYKVRVIRKVEDVNEKTRALIDFFFKKELKFKIEEGKIIIEVEEKIVKLVELFKEKFKEILNLDVEIKKIENVPSIK